MADDVQFIIKAEDQATSVLDKVKAGFGDIAGGAIAAGTAVAGAATAVVGFGLAAVHSFAEAGEQLNQLHEKTGISVGDLSAMKTQAEITGVSFDAVVNGIRMLAKNLDGVKGPSKAAEGALKDIGVSMAELKNLSPDEQFLKIGDALDKVSDPMKKMADAQVLLGKSGLTLLPFFQEGTANMAAMTAQAKSLGTYFDELSAKNAGAAKIAFNTLNVAFEGLTDTLGSILAPIVTNLIVSFIKWIETAQEWVKAHPEIIDAFQAAINILQTLWSVVSDIVVKVFTWISDHWKQIKDTTLTTFGAIKDFWEGTWTAIVNFMTPIIQSIWDALSGWWSRLVDLWDKNMGGVKFNWKAFLDTLGKEFGDLWNGLKTVFKIAWDLFVGVLNIALDLLGGDWKKAWDDLSTTAQKIWGDLWSALGTQIQSFANQALQFLKPVTDAIGAVVSGISSGIKTMSGIGNAIGSAVSGHKAAGGDVFAGQTYMVGENGPEELTMGSSNGYITPNNQMGGSNGTTFNIMINGLMGSSREIAMAVADATIQEFKKHSFAMGF